MKNKHIERRLRKYKQLSIPSHKVRNGVFTWTDLDWLSENNKDGKSWWIDFSFWSRNGVRVYVTYDTLRNHYRNVCENRAAEETEALYPHEDMSGDEREKQLAIWSTESCARRDALLWDGDVVVRPNVVAKYTKWGKRMDITLPFEILSYSALDKVSSVIREAYNMGKLHQWVHDMCDVKYDKYSWREEMKEE